MKKTRLELFKIAKTLKDYGVSALKIGEIVGRDECTVHAWLKHNTYAEYSAATKERLGRKKKSVDKDLVRKFLEQVSDDLEKLMEEIK